MRALFFITAIFFSFLLQAQVNFKTIVPQEPVVAGESFQVQYILEDATNTGSLKPPVFKNFRYVAGPHLYTGYVPSVNGSKPLRNFVYTLEAIKPGRFIIPRTSVVVNGQLLQSNDEWVKVITKEEAILLFNRQVSAMSSDYILKPGEDPYEKIKRNLFLKVLVDKRTCFAGEPVTATFKLYSRLESKSDIVKNPGFYGFTVFDMINLADKQLATEMLNGKAYDVHTIRKVQLYPLQAGNFTIDPMEVKNKVEFSRSAVNKKTEQEIAEGMFGSSEDEPSNKNAVAYETSMSSEPVTITVKSSPEKNKPENFSGATGNFSITASIFKNELKKNEEGWLEVSISGNGNFQQLTAPAIQWPEGIESFEATSADNLDKTKIPLTGSRTFRISFIGAEEGTYLIPAITHAFFDPDSNHYRTIATKPLHFTVKGEKVKEKLVATNNKSINSINRKASLVAGVIVAGLCLFVLGYWLFRKKEERPVSSLIEKEPMQSTNELLQPVSEMALANDPDFYNELHRVIWEKLGQYFGLAGSLLNKNQVFELLRQKNTESEVLKLLDHIFTVCEASIYTTASIETDKNQLLADARKVLVSLK